MDRHATTVALLSEHTLYRRGLAALLRAHGFRRVEEHASAAELRIAAAQRAPLLLVDLGCTRADTMTILRAVRLDVPKTFLVAIGTAAQQAAAAGAFDACLEPPRADVADLLAAVEGRAGPRSPEGRRARRPWELLTERQRDVLRWLAGGLENRDIAARLDIGERAVKAHVSALLELFQVANRTQLALLAAGAGVQPPRRAR